MTLDTAPLGPRGNRPLPATQLGAADHRLRRFSLSDVGNEFSEMGETFAGGGFVFELILMRSVYRVGYPRSYKASCCTSARIPAVTLAVY